MVVPRPSPDEAGTVALFSRLVQRSLSEALSARGRLFTQLMISSSLNAILVPPSFKVAGKRPWAIRR